MKKRGKRIALGLGLSVIGLILAAWLATPGYVDRHFNKTLPHAPYAISPAAEALQRRMTVMDWHADSLLWSRNLLAAHKNGHVDLAKLRAGNVALQMFTTVTKVPKGVNIHTNTGQSDMVKPVIVASGWPVRTWSSLLERALYQGEQLDGFVRRSHGAFLWVRNQRELAALLAARDAAPADAKPVGVLLGTEGAHPLEGKLENVDVLHDAGFRLVGLVHFFDNDIAGSLHGQSHAGLSPFGRQVVERLDALGMIIDLAHASEQAAWDTLALATRPVVVSHTGLRGACNTERNYPDDLMKAIAERGGLIGIGFWQEAACGTSPEAVADSILYGVKLVGADHLALGSDWDGATTEAITAADAAAITDALMRKGLDEASITKIMGGNSASFLARWLPAD